MLQELANYLATNKIDMQSYFLSRLYSEKEDCLFSCFCVSSETN